MDRKKNNNSNTQGGRTNGNNKSKAADNKALVDTTLGLSNLNLGNNNTNTKPKNNNAGKKASKKSTSSSHGSTVAAPSPVSSKKAGPILLGMPDSPMESQDDIDPYVTKIGGVPVRSIARRMKNYLVIDCSGEPGTLLLWMLSLTFPIVLLHQQ